MSRKCRSKTSYAPHKRVLRTVRGGHKKRKEQSGRVEKKIPREKFVSLENTAHPGRLEGPQTEKGPWCFHAHEIAGELTKGPCAPNKAGTSRKTPEI